MPVINVPAIFPVVILPAVNKPSTFNSVKLPNEVTLGCAAVVNVPSRVPALMLVTTAVLL